MEAAYDKSATFQSSRRKLTISTFILYVSFIDFKRSSFFFVRTTTTTTTEKVPYPPTFPFPFLCRRRGERERETEVEGRPPLKVTKLKAHSGRHPSCSNLLFCQLCFFFFFFFCYVSVSIFRLPFGVGERPPGGSEESDLWDRGTRSDATAQCDTKDEEEEE